MVLVYTQNSIHTDKKNKPDWCPDVRQTCLILPVSFWTEPRQLVVHFGNYYQKHHLEGRVPIKYYCALHVDYSNMNITAMVVSANIAAEHSVLSITRLKLLIWSDWNYSSDLTETTHLIWPHARSHWMPACSALVTEYREIMHAVHHPSNDSCWHVIHGKG
jgi:hypothetical protein